jgi:N-sulfoglucosamine sulfohydrolase
MSSPKNILLMIADDLGKYLNCYGDDTTHTPNIDHLASQGTVFDRAFTSTASCSASRSVIYTGRHTHENGQYGLANNRHHFTTFDHIPTAPSLFNESSVGYLTGIIGKVHVGPGAVYPWQVREESDSRNVAWVADRTRTFFKKAKTEDKPFFLTVGFADPHRDLTRSGFGNTDVEKLQDEPRIKHAKYMPEDVRIPPFLSDLPEVRQELAEYYQAIDRLDQGVGMILEQLEKAGAAENTLVVFVSDNGPPFLNSKTTLYDAGVKLPLIIKNPTACKRGIRNPNMISFIDLLPTFLDWAGHGTITDRVGLLGHSFLPIFEAEELITDDGVWRQQVFGSHTFHEVTNYWPTRFMRTLRYKYHRNIAWKLDFPFAADLYGSLTWEGVRNSKQQPIMLGQRKLTSYLERPPEELYDLDEDPNEVHNLAADPKHQERLRSMRAATEEWQLATGDLWLYRDGVSLRLVQHHIDAGLKVPDRFDIDVANPTNQV